MNMRIFPALFLSLLAGCSGEFVTSLEADLAKYPEIRIFVHEQVLFQGDESDLEAGIFRFSYTSCQTDPLKVLQAIDKDAVAEGWRIFSQEGMTRVYKKNLQRYPAQTQDDVVFIEYDVGKGTFCVEWQAG